MTEAIHVLHGTWLPDQACFGLWGEDTQLLNLKKPSAKLLRKSTKNLHPFTTSSGLCLNFIDQYNTNSAPDGQWVQVWLPTTEQGPLLSVQPQPPETELQSWQVNMVTLSAAEIMALLLRLPTELPEEHWRLGADLHYWRHVALWIVHQIVQGDYLPTLYQPNRLVTHTKWSLQYDSEVMRRFSVAMPELCRAMGADINDVYSPQLLLENFMGAAADTYVRSVLEEWQPKQGRTPHTTTSPEQLLFSSFADTKDKALKGSSRGNKILYEQWERWLRPANQVISTAFRLCLRLDPPNGGDGDQWLLTYLLQATDDPSLFVDAMQVWYARGRTATFLDRRFDKPQEHFLEALGLAASLFPPIERSLAEAQPCGVLLTVEEALQFLTEGYPRLTRAGFGVLVPDWWSQRAELKLKPVIKARHKQKKSNESTGLLSRDTLVAYQWQVALGDETLSHEDFEQLVALKRPIVQWRGQWITLDPTHLQAALTFLQNNPEGEGTLPQVLQAIETVDSTLEVQPIHAEGWLDELLTRLRHPDRQDTPPPPAGLTGTLRPYQARGYGWLTLMRDLGFGAILADDMGLGKSITTIALLLNTQQQVQPTMPALIVCPTSVVGNWRHELSRFSPSLRVYSHQGAGRLQASAFNAMLDQTDVVLSSYALLHRDRELLQSVRWSTLVLDEAQNIKNPSTRQAQAARNMQADTRLALTGTPVENRLTELWSIMHFLNVGFLGSQEKFRERFSIPIERYKDEQAAATLKRLTTPFLLRRVKTDPNVINDLPEKFENKVYVSLTPEQATLYETVVREELESVELAASDMQRRGSVLRMLTRLKQICNHPAQFLKLGEDISHDDLARRSGKLIRLTEMIEEVQENRESMLVFTQYAEMGHYLRRYLAQQFGQEVLFLHGGTPAERRTEMVNLFQNAQQPMLFILSLKAGGVGLNLTQASHVFHYDRWYNPAVENQATDRAFRIGQQRNVQVHKLICLGTLEEHIDELIEHKRELADRIVGAGENWLSAMSTAELRDLVMLRQDQLEE